jgi:hypothetical protein
MPLLCLVALTPRPPAAVRPGVEAPEAPEAVARTAA